MLGGRVDAAAAATGSFRGPGRVDAAAPAWIIRAAFGSGSLPGVWLGMALIAHSPFFAALALVLQSSRPIWVLAPTPASLQGSPLPALAAAAAALLSLVSGVSVWHAADETATSLPPAPPPMPPPPPPEYVSELSTPLGQVEIGGTLVQQP